MGGGSRGECEEGGGERLVCACTCVYLCLHVRREGKGGLVCQCLCLWLRLCVLVCVCVAGGLRGCGARMCSWTPWCFLRSRCCRLHSALTADALNLWAQQSGALTL